MPEPTTQLTEEDLETVIFRYHTDKRRIQWWNENAKEWWDWYSIGSLVGDPEWPPQPLVTLGKDEGTATYSNQFGDTMAMYTSSPKRGDEPRNYSPLAVIKYGPVEPPVAQPNLYLGTREEEDSLVDQYGHRTEAGEPVVVSETRRNKPAGVATWQGSQEEDSFIVDYYGPSPENITNVDRTKLPAAEGAQPSARYGSPEEAEAAAQAMGPGWVVDVDNAGWFTISYQPEQGITPYQEETLALQRQQEERLGQEQALTQRQAEFNMAQDALRLGLDIQRSPGDWLTYMSLLQGTQPIIPRTGLPGFGGMPQFGGQAPQMPLFGQQAALPPGGFAPEQVGRIGATQAAGFLPSAQAGPPQFQAPGLPPTPAPMPWQTGQFPAGFALPPPSAQAQQRAAARQQETQIAPGTTRMMDLAGDIIGVPNEAVPRAQAAGYRLVEAQGITAGQLGEMPEPANEAELAKKLRGQQYLTKAGYQFMPTPGFETQRQIENRVWGPGVGYGRGGLQPPSPTPSWNELMGLIRVSPGQQPKQFPSFGFPGFRSAQEEAAQTPAQREMFRAGVEIKGGFWPDYLSQEQATRPTWGRVSPFQRAIRRA